MSLSKEERGDLVEQIIQTNLFGTVFAEKNNSFMLLKGTSYEFFISSLGTDWFHGNMRIVSFEEVLENVPREIKEELIYHMDLLRSR